MSWNSHYVPRFLFFSSFTPFKFIHPQNKNSLKKGCWNNWKFQLQARKEEIRRKLHYEWWKVSAFFFDNFKLASRIKNWQGNQMWKYWWQIEITYRDMSDSRADSIKEECFENEIKEIRFMKKSSANVFRFSIWYDYGVWKRRSSKQLKQRYSFHLQSSFYGWDGSPKSSETLQRLAPQIPDFWLHNLLQSHWILHNSIYLSPAHPNHSQKYTHALRPVIRPRISNVTSINSPFGKPPTLK